MNYTSYSYSQILTMLEDFASSHTQIQRFATDFPEQLQNYATTGATFPFMYVAPIDSSYAINTTRHRVRVYLLDQLEKDRSNVTSILNSTNLTMEDLKHYLGEENDSTPVILLGEPTAVPLNNFALDYLSGWYMDCEIEIDSHSVCEIPFLNPPIISGFTCDIEYTNDFLRCGDLPLCPTIINIEADIAALSASTSGDTYTTGFTFDGQNTFTIGLNDGNEFNATINQLNINGPITATTFYGNGSNLTGIQAGFSGWTGSSGNNSIIHNNGSGNVAGDNSIVGGYYNHANGLYLSIGGGFNNTINGYHSSIAGGQSNTINGYRHFIGGGYYNNITNGYHSVIVGGFANTLTGNDSAIVGGNGNTASGATVFVGGGQSNKSIATFTSVLNGKNNQAYGNYSGIFGGRNNIIDAGFELSSIAGGRNNRTLNSLGFIGGGRYNRTGYMSTVAGGNTNYATGLESIVGGGRTNIASGSFTSVLGGINNKSTYSASAIGGGAHNIAYGAQSTVAGGLRNGATGHYSTIGGGKQNSGTTAASTVVGGSGNLASGGYSVAGGRGNTASGNYSNALGGFSNVAQGSGSIVVGGRFNAATGNDSIAGGNSTSASGGFTISLGGYLNSASANHSTAIGGSRNNVSGTYSAILGGIRNTITGTTSGILAGSGNTINANYSAILAGSGITATQDNTAYVPFLNIQSATTDNTITNVLVKDTNGKVYLRDSSSIGVSGNFLPLSGGTVTGDTTFTSGLTGTTLFIDTKISVGDIDTMTINGTLITSSVAIDQTANDGAELELHRHSNSTQRGATLYGARSRTTGSTDIIVQNNDNLLDIVAIGFDGTDYATSSGIFFEVDGTPASNDMPGRIVFKVSPDGSQTLTEAVRISNDGTTLITGQLKINNLEYFTVYTATTSASTYTIDCNNNGNYQIITCTASATTLSYSGAQVGAYNFVIVATGTNAVSLATSSGWYTPAGIQLGFDNDVILLQCIYDGTRMIAATYENLNEIV